MQCVAMCCGVLRRVEVCCSVMRCVTECCSVLQCVVDKKDCTFHIDIDEFWQTIRCNLPELTATLGNTLRHTATHCNILQRT